MCMVDDSDGSVTEISGLLQRMARVTHTCKECCRTIDKGETYFVESYVFDGDFHTHKTCAHCKVARDWLQAECGGWLYEGVEEDIREHVFSRMYPMSLARIAVGMQWKWRTPKGRLMPIPAMPQTTHEAALRREGTT